MTVQSTVSRIDYSGNGTSTDFAVPFYFINATDLVVLLVSSAGVSVTQLITTNYTVTGAGDESGGQVSMVVAPPIGYRLVILRDPPVTQLIDYQDNDPFPAETHELGLDKLTMLCQRAFDKIARAFTLTDADTSGASTTLPIPTANSVIAWDSTASALVNLDAGTLATTIVAASINVDTFSGNGVQTDFILMTAPLAENNTNVFVNGIYQQKSSYSLSGTTLTFNSPPALGVDNIEVEYAQALTFPVTSLSPNSVGSTELNALSVTTAKIANFAVTFGKLLGNIFTGATTETITSSDLIVFSDVSDTGNTKVGLVSDIVSMAPSITVITATTDPTFADSSNNAASTNWVIGKIRSLFNVGTSTAPMFACRAWVNFNGTGTVAIRAGGNVSSITDNGTGDYTVNFTIALQDANYSVSGICAHDLSVPVIGLTTLAAGSCRILVNNGTGGAQDKTIVALSFFR